MDEELQNNQTQEESTNNKKKRALKRVGAVAIGIGIFFAGGLAHYFTLDSELRSLIRLKNRIQRSYYQEITDEQFYNAAFSGINGVLDAYSGYLSPEEYAKTLTQATGQQSGLGLSFSSTATGAESLKILRVVGNSPAEEAGIVRGEYIIGYGATENDLEKKLDFTSFSLFLADYEANETLYLKIRGVDGQTRVLPIARKVYVENYVYYRTSDSAYAFSGDDALTAVERGTPLAALPQDTAYIRLESFNGNAAGEFAAAMNLFRMHNKKNLILDLRGNTGGYLNIMLEIASYFCKNTAEKKPIVALADYGEKKEAFAANGNYFSEYFLSTSRITVLADEYTASASECLIGCMYDYGTISYQDICLAKRNGVAKTFGKGIMQTTFPLSVLDKDALKLTTAKICWPVSGNCIHGRGVLPDDGALQAEENADFEVELQNCLSALFP
jgi:carboxyl-terminal processing protease